MYLVDSNVLIEAKNRYYAFDNAPGFWEWLERAHRAGRVFSIEKVEEELLRGDDELAKWAQGHHSFFRQLDQRRTQYFSRLSECPRGHASGRARRTSGPRRSTSSRLRSPTTSWSPSPQPIRAHWSRTRCRLNCHDE